MNVQFSLLHPPAFFLHSKWLSSQQIFRAQLLNCTALGEPGIHTVYVNDTDEAVSAQLSQSYMKALDQKHFLWEMEPVQETRPKLNYVRFTTLMVPLSLQIAKATFDKSLLVTQSLRSTLWNPRLQYELLAKSPQAEEVSNMKNRDWNN